MFDFDAGKLMIIATVALVVIGPKDLPRVLRQVGQMVTRVRRMASEFQGQFMDAMKEADLQDLRAEVAKLKDTATLDIDFNPVQDIKAHLDDAMKAPMGSVPIAVSTGGALDLTPLPEAVPIQAEPVASIAAAGFGPAVELAVLSEPAYATGTAAEIDAASLEPTSDRRKAVVVRRRIGSRFEGPPGRNSAAPRSRILPARRETPDR